VSNLNGNSCELKSTSIRGYDPEMFSLQWIHIIQWPSYYLNEYPDKCSAMSCFKCRNDACFVYLKFSGSTAKDSGDSDSWFSKARAECCE